MKKRQILYDRWEETPHKWYTYVLVTLPLSGINLLIQLIPILLAPEVSSFYRSADAGWVYGSTLCICAAVIIVSVVAFIGLLKRKWYGVQALLILYGLRILDGVMTLLATAIHGEAIGYGVESLADGLSVLVLYIPHLLLSRIYFRKRRLLFAPPPAATTPSPVHPRSSQPVTAALRSASPAGNDRSVPDEDGGSSVALLMRLREECETEQEAAPREAQAPTVVQRRSPTALKVLCGALACACIVFGLAFAHQLSVTTALKEDLADQTARAERADAQLTVLRSRVEAYREELRFWDHSAVIVMADEDTYHSYGCKYLDTDGGYLVYDILFADSLGFEPCIWCASVSG